MSSSADAQLERETVRAIADALLGVSAVVDIGGRVGAGRRAPRDVLRGPEQDARRAASAIG